LPMTPERVLRAIDAARDRVNAAAAAPALTTRVAAPDARML